jgi:hypothetical protein
MQIKPLTVFRTINGSEMKDEEGKPLTLRTVCVEALLTPMEEDQKSSGSEKIMLSKLADLIYGLDEPDLTSEQISLLKRRINQRFPFPYVVAQAYAMLDPIQED